MWEKNWSCTYLRPAVLSLWVILQRLAVGNFNFVGKCVEITWNAVGKSVGNAFFGGK